MYRKAFSTLLALFYLAITFGFSANLHFCNGHLENISLVYNVSLTESHETNCCSETHSCCSSDMHSCSIQSNSDCCNNVYEFVQFDNDQVLVSNAKIALQPIFSDTFIHDSDCLIHIPSINLLGIFERKIHLTYPPPHILFQQIILYA